MQESVDAKIVAEEAGQCGSTAKLDSAEQAVERETHTGRFLWQQGFTLIELMIVVAIIGVLAGIAIPNFLKFQMRSKVGEGKVNLSAIRTAEEAYFFEIGTYLTWPLNPAAAPSSQKRAWTPCPNVPPQAGDPGHCFIGWEPEGDVYYSYIVATDSARPSSQFFAVGESDIDGDGTLNLWGYQKPSTSGQFTIAATQGCNTVLNVEQSTTSGANVPMTKQVGPCNSPLFGISVF